MDKKVLFRSKISDIFLSLLKNGEMIEADIAKDTGLTYCHLVKIIKKFEKEEIISKERNGRTQLINFTAKGKMIAEHISGMYQKLGYLEKKETMDVKNA